MKLQFIPENIEQMFETARTKKMKVTYGSSMAAISARRQLYFFRDKQRKNLEKTYGVGTPCSWDSVAIKQIGPVLELGPVGSDVIDAKIEVEE